MISADLESFCRLNRYKFENAHVLRTLQCVIEAIYTEGVGDQKLPGSLLSLETLYEMVLTHSQFLDVLLSGEKGVNTTDMDGTKGSMC